MSHRRWDFLTLYTEENKQLDRMDKETSNMRDIKVKNGKYLYNLQG